MMSTVLRRSTRSWLIAGGLLLLVMAVVLQAALGGRRLSKKLVCLSNLKHVAKAFAMYGSELEGFPFATSSDAVRAMIERGIINRDQTVSPRTSKELVLQYPSGIPTLDDNRAIIAYEQTADGLDDACVLYADGHGQCVAAQEYGQILSHNGRGAPAP